MARRKPKARPPAFQLFNVAYEDGSMTSNRKVPSDALDDTYGEDIIDLARAFLEKQDAEIAERSGRARAKISTIKAA
ncbi:MAG: hypothetical protein ACPGOV_15235 [Magnetovibrionaceae bacterium]